MSDDDKDVDIESDEDEMIVSSGIQHHTYHSTSPGQPQFQSQAEKRAHHNALERKRRDHIKDSFHSLRDSIPTVHADKITPKSSRAQILNKATDYIQYMRKKNTVHQQDIEELRKQNHVLEAQVRQLEGLKASVQGKEEKQESGDTAEDSVGVKVEEKSDLVKIEENSDSEPAEGSETRTSRRKKLKT